MGYCCNQDMRKIAVQQIRDKFFKMDPDPVSRSGDRTRIRSLEPDLVSGTESGSGHRIRCPNDT